MAQFLYPVVAYHSGQSKSPSMRPGIDRKTNWSLWHSLHSRSNAQATSPRMPERRDKDILLFGVPSVYHPGSRERISDFIGILPVD